MQDILRVENTFPNGVPEEFGAGDGIRTRNPQLGKLMPSSLSTRKAHELSVILLLQAFLGRRRALRGVLPGQLIFRLAYQRFPLRRAPLPFREDSSLLLVVRMPASHRGVLRRAQTTENQIACKCAHQRESLAL